MGPNMAVMGPPMPTPPMGPPMCPPGQFCGPVPPMGMMPCGPKQSLLGPFTFAAGYVDTFKGSGYFREYGLNNAAVVIPSQEFRLKMNGAWLGCAQNFYLGNNCGTGRNCGLVASGGLLIPSDTPGTVHERGFVVVPVTTDFTANNEWGKLDAAGFCEVFRSPTCDYGLMLLGGFRWDYVNTKLNATSLSAAGAIVQTFRNDVTFNSYLPYLGLQCTRSFCNSSANVRFIVTPAIWGDLKLKETVTDTGIGTGGGNTDAPFDWGNLMELYAVYSLCVSKNLQAGAYFDWTNLQFESKSRNNGFTNALGTMITPEKIHFDRNSWSVGGTVLINFDFDPCL